MAVLCFLLIVACFYDYGKGRIPNWLLVVIFLFGCGYSGVSRGRIEACFFLAECCAVMILLYPLFKIGVLGAGDVKLYGVCAGYLPRDKFLLFLFLSLLIAAVISLIKMIKESNAIERISYLCEYLLDVAKHGEFRLYIENESERRKAGICLAGPILGSILLHIGGIY